ncbi:MAG: hypothetical protein ACREK9_13795 [Candidatus Rokuibacteriota bacterium]
MRRDVVDRADGRGTDRARPWWRRLVAGLAPSRPDVEERLARRYAAEVRLARGLAQDAEPLVRYPHQRVRVLDAAERARGRAERIRRALDGLGHAVTEPIAGSGRSEPTAWKRLRGGLSELSGMSEACLADAHAVEREYPGIAGLLYELHGEMAEDRRDLIWTLAQLGGAAAETSLEEVAA